MTRSEEQIILERIRQGEESLYERFIDLYSARLFSVIIGVVRNREDAQEIVQDVFTKAFFSLDKFRGDSSFSTWLFRIAYNMSVSKIRRKRRYLNVERVEDFVTEQYFDETKNHLGKEQRYSMAELLLNQLTLDERFIILSFYAQQKSIKEIAQIIGKSENNTKVKLFRIRQKLCSEVNKTGELKLESNV